MASETDRLSIGPAGLDIAVDVATWGGAEPSIVFVHDGLGSIAQWGDVPGRTAAVSGRGVLAYDRAGHGGSAPVPTGAHPADWMTTEADVPAALIERVATGPVRLVGHSDGGSIAMLCAVRHPHRVRDLVRPRGARHRSGLTRQPDVLLHARRSLAPVGLGPPGLGGG